MVVEDAVITRAHTAIKESTVTVMAHATIIVGFVRIQVRSTNEMPLLTTRWVTQCETANDSSGAVVIDSNLLILQLILHLLLLAHLQIAMKLLFMQKPTVVLPHIFADQKMHMFYITYIKKKVHLSSCRTLPSS